MQVPCVCGSDTFTVGYGSEAHRCVECGLPHPTVKPEPITIAPTVDFDPPQSVALRFASDGSGKPDATFVACDHQPMELEISEDGEVWRKVPNRYDSFIVGKHYHVRATMPRRPAPQFPGRMVEVERGLIATGYGPASPLE